MNTHHTRTTDAAVHAPEAQIKPIAATLTSDFGIGAAANAEDALNDGDDRRVNPLWMITVGLAAFFAFVALVVTFN